MVSAQVSSATRLAKPLFSLLASAWLLPAVHAGTLDDVRAKLQSLNAPTEIHGVLSVRSVGLPLKEKGEDSGPAPEPEASAELQLEVDAGAGLGIRLAPTVLQRIQAESQAHDDDPEKPVPLTNLLNDAGVTNIERLVSAAPSLLRTLNGAGAPVLKPAELSGKAVQALSVTLPLMASKKDKSNISDYRGQMTLWLDADNTPLAYEQTYHAKFCKFFLCVSVDETRKAALQVITGRLVAVSYSDETRQSGLGQDGDTRTDYTLTLTP